MGANSQDVRSSPQPQKLHGTNQRLSARRPQLRQDDMLSPSCPAHCRGNSEWSSGNSRVKVASPSAHIGSSLHGSRPVPPRSSAHWTPCKPSPESDKTPTTGLQCRVGALPSCLVNSIAESEGRLRDTDHIMAGFISPLRSETNPEHLQGGAV